MGRVHINGMLACSVASILASLPSMTTNVAGSIQILLSSQAERRTARRADVLSGQLRRPTLHERKKYRWIRARWRVVVHRASFEVLKGPPPNACLRDSVQNFAAAHMKAAADLEICSESDKLCATRQVQVITDVQAVR